MLTRLDRYLNGLESIVRSFARALIGPYIGCAAKLYLNQTGWDEHSYAIVIGAGCAFDTQRLISPRASALKLTTHTVPIDILDFFVGIARQTQAPARIEHSHRLCVGAARPNFADLVLFDGLEAGKVKDDS